MYSIPGLPAPGSNITVHITRVNLNPLCVLVELWGSFAQESKLEYQRMRADIQFPKERFSGVEGNPGDLCLVQILETWYRARIVTRHGKDYDVFLIDEGKTLAVNFYNLAWGQKDLFLLPPEVEFCVLANILPLSPENKWSPVALEFLSSLRGRRFEGYVQDVLIPHRTFLLDIPSISKQMYEMGFAKKLSSEMFKFFVERSLKSLTGAVAIPENKLFSSDKGKDQTESTAPHRAELIQSTQVYFYPQIQAETVETVIITELVHPSRFFCQLRVFSQELKRMTEQITQHYEGRSGIEKIKSEALGSACAARGSDGKWYRSVLQQVFPCKNVVEVLHVDYGIKECVPIGSLRSLAPEFFRMPVVTYACSMLGISDQGAGWSTSQVKYLKSLLLNQVVIAKFEYQNYSEGVYYVTLYGDENMNINNLFGMREKCLLEVQKSPGEYAICKTVSPKSLASLGKRGQGDCLVPKTLVEGRQAKSAAGKLKLNASCEAVVEFVVDPSEFWIRKHEYSVEFDQLMNSISNLYDNAPEMEGIVRTPTVGLYCVAKSKDSSFYRAVVNEVLGQQVKVYFVDYGNTEIVDWHNLKVLPSKYQELPALALKCCLSGIYPKDDNWSRNAIMFFTKAVADKVLEVCVSAKLPDRYAVHLTSALADGEQSINKLLCSAGYAECRDFKKPVSKQGRVPLPGPKVQCSTEKNSHLDAAKDYSCPLSSSIPAVGSETKPVFKEHLFPIGSSVGVKVSHIESPNDFWCQIYKNLSSLNLMMRDIQSHCSTSPELYQPSETACIARCPENGLWYRALVIKKHSSLEVDVLYIDYGKMERVFIKDLRAINPLFLQMEGQAFRCSLYNLIQAFGHDPLNWSDAAKSEFQDFVDIADSTGLDLKCTIYAVMYDSSKVVFNVVDLETPFQSVCSLLVQKGLAQRAPLKKAPQPPFHLDTYYYSSHDIKIGGEEEVFVTYVKTVGNFYCHLGKNVDIVEQLAEKVNYLCQQLECTGCPQTFGTVCFAKYSDGKWYRGQIKSYIPTIQVYFVDYGDTQEVDKSDLLPIPIEASELMSVPVQAVACGLSDIAADVPDYVNVWFENVVVGNSFRAVVVSKEPCGKLMVDLYDGKMQLTSKLKETFPGETSTKENIYFEAHGTSLRKREDSFSKNSRTIKTRDTCEVRSMQQMSSDNSGSAKVIRSQSRDEGIQQDQQNKVKQFCSVAVQWAPEINDGTSENKYKDQICPLTLECSNAPPVESVESKGKHGKDSHAPFGSRENVVQKIKSLPLPKLQDLPSKCIKPGLVCEVYVSHSNSPSSFFVQLTKEEEEIYLIVEKLNRDLPAISCVDIDKLQPDDLVCAEFPDDNSWYRAVVKNTYGNGTLDVEFIDFGNTATISSSNIRWLDKSFLKVPRLSVHCLLSGVQSAISKPEWPQIALMHFKEAIGESEGGKKLTCNFIKQSGSLWEVSLQDRSTLLADYLIEHGSAVSWDSGVLKDPDSQPKPSGGTISGKSFLPRKPADDPSTEILPSRYKSCNISEGQTLEVYASSLVSPEYFWCQFADSDSLQIIAELADETGNSVDTSAKFIEDLFPGSPCLALFKDDEHWYRAEVKSKTQDVLSIRFVDYGNEVEVDHDSVRPVPSELLEIPTQAFLCLLEGFDHSCGSWDIGAIDKFYELLADQPLEVTILNCEKPEIDEPSLFNVKVQCNGQLITDVMRNYWKGFVAGSDDEMVDLEQELPQLESTEILQHEDVIELKLAVQRTVTDFLSLQGEVEMNAEQSISPTNIPDECYLKYKTKVITELQEVEEITEGTLQQPNVQLNFQYEQNLESVEEKCVELACQISASGHQETVFDEVLESRTPTSTNGEPERGQCLLKESNEKNEVFTNMVEDATDNACLKMEQMVCDVDADADLKLVASCDPTVELSENGTIIVNKPLQDLPYNCPLENNPDNLTEGLDKHNAGVPSSQEENGWENAAKLGLGDFKDLAMAACSIELVEDVKTSYAENQNRKPLETLSASSLTECPSYKLGEPADESFDELLDSQEDLCFDEQVEGSDIYEEVFKQCLTDPLSANPTDLKEAEDFPTEMEVHRAQNVEPRTEPGFSQLEGELSIGSNCVVWSYVYNTWCKARILKIYVDRIKVLLLESNAEAIVDLQNIWKNIPEGIVHHAEPVKVSSAEVDLVSSEYAAKQDASLQDDEKIDSGIDATTTIPSFCTEEQQLVQADPQAVTAGVESGKVPEDVELDKVTAVGKPGLVNEETSADEMTTFDMKMEFPLKTSEQIVEEGVNNEEKHEDLDPK
nr:PREDICTED: tudor domain-containing protein 6 isoform X1 [Lepisosteus oculatus]XP_015205868.1 PREDICTED: tudor domain-containing protein 6 isoform X1 [Lepisosteus oculatus]